MLKLRGQGRAHEDSPYHCERELVVGTTRLRQQRNHPCSVMMALSGKGNVRCIVAREMEDELIYRVTLTAYTSEDVEIRDVLSFTSDS